MQLNNYPDATFRGNLLRKYFRRGDAMNRARSIIIDMTNQLDRTLEEQKSKLEEQLNITFNQGSQKDTHELYFRESDGGICLREKK